MSNILDVILNNQNTVMNNQAIIMNKLNAITTAMGKTPTDELASPAAVVEEVATSTESVETPATPETTDVSASEPVTEKKGLINDHGIPWNKEVHSGSQKCNNDGHWKAIKGVDKEKLAAYNAQFLNDAADETPAAPATPATPAVPAAPATPATPAVPAAPATPATPAAPSSPAAPAAPSSPAAPAAPAAPSLPATPAAPSLPATPVDDKSKAIAIISELTNTFKVPYLNITSGIVQKHGTHLIDQVPADKHGEILEDVNTWLDELKNIDADINTASDLDISTSGEHSIKDNVFLVIQNEAGVDDFNLIPFNKLADTANAVEAFVTQWVNWYDSTTA